METDLFQSCGHCWVFFTVQLSHPYMTTGKTIALTRQTFVGKVMSLFFNMLSRLVITQPSNPCNLCRPCLLLPSIIPCFGCFFNESVLHVRWPKYWSFSFSISPSSEYSGLSSFRIDWFDLFAVQGSYGTSVINFLRTFHAVFHSGCTSLQWTNIPSSTHPPQHLSLVFC